MRYVSREDLDRKLNEIIELLKPKQPAPVDTPDPVEGYEECSDDFKVTPSGGSLVKLDDTRILSACEGYRLRKIDGLHHGPAFVVERKKA